MSSYTHIVAALLQAVPTRQASMTSLILMSVSYVFYFIADYLIIVTSYRRRTYGQHPVPAGILLGSAIAALIGPFTPQSHLFPYGLASRPSLLVVWAVSVLLQGLIFAQYFAYSNEVPKHRLLTGLIAAFGSFLFAWTFIEFYQDLYVNEIFAVATLLMAVGYVMALSRHSTLHGMPVLGAWCYTAAITLAELGTYAGSMSAAYPEATASAREAAVRNIAALRNLDASRPELKAVASSAGYSFIYFLWIAASVLMIYYSWRLGQKEREARATAVTP